MAIKDYSLRNTTTIEERRQMVIDKGNLPQNSKRGMSEYLSQPNIRDFNRILVSRSFDLLKEPMKSEMTHVLNDYDQCLEECVDYFKLCDQYAIVPTVASLCLYLGIGKERFYGMIKDPRRYNVSNVLATSLATCRAFHEQAFLAGEVPSQVFIFYAKNYYGMKDTSDITVNNSNPQEQIQTQTLDTIKEQIRLEKEKDIVVIDEEPPQT